MKASRLGAPTLASFRAFQSLVVLGYNDSFRMDVLHDGMLNARVLQFLDGLLKSIGFLFFVMVRALHFSGWNALTMMFPIFLAYLDLIEAFLHLGLMKLSSMQLCRLRKASRLMLSLLACH